MATHQVLDSTGAASATVDVDENGGVTFQVIPPVGDGWRYTSVGDVLELVHALGGTIPDLEP